MWPSFINENPKYEKARILERMTEPDRRVGKWTGNYRRSWVGSTSNAWNTAP